MAPKSVLKAKLTTQLDCIPAFLKKACAKIRALPFTKEDLFQIKLALEEALTNAMRHGNRLQENLSVEVSLSADRRKLVMEVADHGRGFDHSRLPDPTLEENKEKPSGRGVFLIKSLMDKVEFRKRGRIVRMTKFFKTE